MALLHRLLVTFALCSFSLTVMASMVDINRIPGSYLKIGPRNLVSRQTSDCPGYGDCDCETWGAACDVSDFSWVSCSNLPDACGSSTGTATATATPTNTKTSGAATASPSCVAGAISTSPTCDGYCPAASCEPVTISGVDQYTCVCK